MIILGINVISEMMRLEPDPTVLALADAAGQFHTTATSFAEVEDGTAIGVVNPWQ